MRFGCLTFLILTLLVLLISCTKELPDFEETVVKEPIIREEIAEEIPDEPVVEAPVKEISSEITAKTWDEAHSLSHKDKANEFLTAIKLGYKDILKLYMSGDDTIEELLKIKADFTVKSEKSFIEYYDKNIKTRLDIIEENAEGHEKYEGFPHFDCYVAEVVMRVSESESEFFPVGEYDYTIKTSNSSFCLVEYFGPSDRYEIYEGSEIPDIADSALYKNHKFVENYLHDTTAYGSEALDPSINSDTILHVVIHTLMEETDYILNITRSEFKEYLTLRFGYTDEEILDSFVTALSKKTYIKVNDDGSYVGACGHGYSSFMKDLTSIKRNGNLHTYSYTFYADSTHTIPTREMQFTFEENKDSDVMTLRNIKAAKLRNLNLVFLSP